MANADLLQLLLQLADLRPQDGVVGQQLLVLVLEVLGLKGEGRSEQFYIYYTPLSLNCE